MVVNGQPGGILLDGGGQPISVIALEIADGHVQGISSIVNPDKLRHLGAADPILGRPEWS